MIRYRELIPPPRLAPFLRCVWMLRGTVDCCHPPRRVLPDGCADLLFDFAATPTRARWIGVMTHARLVTMGAGRIDLMGLRFAPAGLYALLRVPLAEITDTAVGIDALPLRSRRNLLDRLQTVKNNEARVRLALDTLLAIEPDPEALRGVAALTALTNMPELPRVPTLAANWGITERSLQRRFSAWVGVSPKQHLRYLRFERSLAKLRSDTNGALLAVEQGYADQSHWIREFREFAGLSPRTWLAENSYQLSSVSDSFNTGVGDAAMLP